MTYLITNNEGDIIDVLELTEKQVKKYLDNNPNYSVSLATLEDTLTFEDDDFLTGEIEEFGETY